MRATVLSLIFIVRYLCEEQLIGVNLKKEVFLKSFVLKMTHVYTNEELMDIVLVYEETRQNSRAVSRLYAHQFPNRHLPHHETFTAVLLRARAT